MNHETVGPLEQLVFDSIGDAPVDQAVVDAIKMLARRLDEGPLCAPSDWGPTAVALIKEKVGHARWIEEEIEEITGEVAMVSVMLSRAASATRNEHCLVTARDTIPENECRFCRQAVSDAHVAPCAEVNNPVEDASGFQRGVEFR